MRTLITITLIYILFSCNFSKQSNGKTESDISQEEINWNGADINRNQANQDIQKKIYFDSVNIIVPVSIYQDEESRQLNDTLVSLDYLIEIMPAVTNINAPKLDITFLKEYYHAVLYNDTIKIEIEKEEFKLSDKVLTYKRGNLGQSFLTKINGKPYWGTDYSFIPDYEIKAFRIFINDAEIAIEEEMFNDLYNPNLYCQQFSQANVCSINAFVLATGEILIIMKNGDAAATYYPVWIIKDKKIITRLVAEGY